jgi:hypothetical protein
MKKSSTPWHLWQAAFGGILLAAFATGFLPIEPANAPFSAVLRVFMGMIGVLGTMFVLLLRRSDEASALKMAPSRGDISEGPLAVTYRVSFAEAWAFNLWLLPRIPMSWMNLVFAGIWAPFLFGGAVTRAHLLPSPAIAPLLFAAGCAAWMVYTILFVIMNGWLRTVKKEHICTTSLTPTGVYDQMPERSTSLNWGQIKSIDAVDGGIVFRTTMGGNHIPATAFHSAESGKAFLDRATTLWKSKGEAWPAVEREAQLP